jgi:phosphoribosyl 1,2-cyclic phosphodiesterase
MPVVMMPYLLCDRFNFLLCELQVILTHEHADAILGLDDIRGVQPVNAYNRIEPLPVFLTKHSMSRFY